MKKRQISIRILKAAVLISTILAMLPVYVHASYSVGEFSGEFAKGTTIHELWHTMTISHSGKLVLSIRCTGLTFSSVHLVKPDKSSDITYNSSYNLDNISITSDHLAPGTYYIKISYGGVEGTYTIQAVFTDADDNLTESEPNDTIDTAKSFTDNQVTGILGYTDYVSYTDRKDWFKYEVTRSGKLVVNFTCTGAASVSLWKPDKSGEITYKSFVTNASLTSDHLAPGTYYIEVSSVGVYGTYKVQAVFTNADDNVTESEPNDTINAAKSLTDNQVTGILGYTDYVSYTDREDWFRYEVTRSGKLVLNFTCTGLGLSTVYLWKPDKSGYITYKSLVNNASLTSDHLAPGTYYIKVSSGGIYGIYTIQAIFTPDVSAIGLQDDIVCLRILSGIPVSSLEIIITDISKDGRIGMEECVYILQVVAGLRP